MAPTGEVVKRLRLTKGFSTGEGNAIQIHPAMPDLPHQGEDGDNAPSLEVMRLRVMAAGAMVRTSLREECKAKAGSIDNGLGNGSGNAQGEHGVRGVARGGAEKPLPATKP